MSRKRSAYFFPCFTWGVKNIRLGPTLPSFLTPEVVGILSDKFNIMPISTVNEDLEAILGQ